jgi:hypothetical protein
MMESNDEVTASIKEFMAFYLRKLAGLEARFVVLCHRAQEIGIDCSDLCDGHVLPDRDKAPPLGFLN